MLLKVVINKLESLTTGVIAVAIMYSCFLVTQCILFSITFSHSLLSLLADGNLDAHGCTNSAITVVQSNVVFIQKLNSIISCSVFEPFITKGSQTSLSINLIKQIQ